jgi:hypothetical protein
MYKDKISIIVTTILSVGGIEIIHSIPTDPSFYSELFKLLLQLIIAIISIIKLLKSNKNKDNA